MECKVPGPPTAFIPAVDVKEAAFAPVPPAFAAKPRRRQGRRAQGVRYEKALHAALKERFGDAYRSNPWLQFRDQHGWRWCQPDALLDLGDGRTVVIEAKYQHTPNAWWQLMHLYLPVLRCLSPERAFAPLEVVKWYDPLIAFPCAVQLTASPEQADFSDGAFGVHIWKP